jgi:predicted amidophosphoribosyltransferase
MNEREKKTVRLMIGIFCRGRHGTKRGLCSACAELLRYAHDRLERCPFPIKPKCSDCKVHCYAPAKRATIQKVMRYAGKRMILHHPVAAMLHFARKRPQ